MKILLRKLFILAVLLGQFFPAANSDSISLDKKLAINKELTKTAESLCEVSTEGEQNASELTGEVKFELNALIKKLGNFGLEGEAKHTKSNYKNVLQKDLASLISKSMDCKVDVFKYLKDELVEDQRGDTPKEDSSEDSCKQRCGQFIEDCKNIAIGKHSECRKNCETASCSDQCDLDQFVAQNQCRIFANCNQRCVDAFPE